MEHLAGQTLAERLKKRPLSVAQALTVGAEIAEALAAAHREGVIHRDLKPANVMLTKAGAKLLDFGLAKLRASRQPPGGGAAVDDDAALSHTGTIVGTFPYMAPEQLEGKAADARSDLFAFGCVLYEILTGQRAFTGDSQASIISAIMSSQPPAPSSIEPATPPAVDRLVQRCLAKDPDGRWQTATDLAEELRWLSTGSGSVPAMVLRPGRWWEARRRSPWFAGAAMLLAVAGRRHGGRSALDRRPSSDPRRGTLR